MADDFITLDKQTYASLQEEIIALRQQVASFYAKTSKGDEYLLNAVIQASNYLLTMDDFEQSINGALAVLGMAINTEYISIWECHAHPLTEESVISQRWYWGNLELNHSQLQNIHEDGFAGWGKIVCRDNYITEPTKNLPELLKLPLQCHGIETLLIIPMVIEGNLWGIITLGEPQNNQQWTDTQRNILYKSGLNFVGAIAQHQVKVKLQESQQLLQLVMDNIPQFVMWKDRNCIYQGCNNKLAKVAGFDSPEAIVGKSDDDMPWTPSESQWYRKCDRRVMESGEAELHIIETQQQADGRQAWLDTNKIPLRDGKGNVVGVLITVEDITERKQAEEKLELIQFAFDYINDSAFLIEASGCLSYVNATSCRNLGYSHGELMNMTIFDIDDVVFHVESWSCYWQKVKELKFLSLESVHRTKDGREFPVEVSINYFEFHGKEYNYAIAHDITKRKEVEVELRQLNEELERRVEERTNQLRQKEVQYRSIFEAVNDGIFIHDLDTGNIVAVNPAACRIFGYSHAELLNIHPIQLIHPDYHQVFANFIDTIRTGHQFYGEAVDIHKDGTLFDIETSGSLCMYQGKYHGLVVIRDISDRKQAEIQLKQQAEDLENTLYELQCTQSQLIQSEKLSSLGEMVAGVAHEVNNPINFIHGNLIPATEYTQDLLRLLELYQQYYPNPPQEIEEEIEAMDLEFLKIDIIKLLSSMRVGTKRIREIVLSLRNFSRLDEAEFKRVDIHEGLDSTLMILHNRLKATPERPEIAIVKEYASLPPIECYPGQLNQVFMNILANAIDALEEYNQKRTNNEIIANPNCIRIYTYKITDNLVIINISDNGAGIPPEVQKKLFDPFFTTKDVGKGTGLGLSISYQIVVEKHGGKLSCQSTLGKGTEFAIEIPIIQG